MSLVHCMHSASSTAARGKQLLLHLVHLHSMHTELFQLPPITDYQKSVL